MRLLFLIHSLSSGGAERVTVNLASYWAAKGWQVAIATISGAEFDFYTPDARVERISLNLAVDSSQLLAAIGNNLARLRRVRGVLKDWRPDVAVGMMTPANVYLALASRGLHVRCIGSERIHPPRLSLGKVWEQLRSITYGHLDAVVALTERSAEWIRERTSARHVFVIPNPVVWPPMVQEPLCDPIEVMRPGRRICLAVGRLSNQKGFDLLLRAFSSVAPLLPEWDLVIVGEGEMRSYLEREVERLGLAGRAFLPGRVGNIGDWYRAAHLYVLSSRFEGFPNTLLEAMAGGLPAVAFDCETGPSDIIRDGIDGLLVRAGDEGALAGALTRVMADEDFRKRLAARAVDVRERFSFDRIGYLWEQLFERVMSK